MSEEVHRPNAEAQLGELLDQWVNQPLQSAIGRELRSVEFSLGGRLDRVGKAIGKLESRATEHHDQAEQVIHKVAGLRLAIEAAAEAALDRDNRNLADTERLLRSGFLATAERLEQLCAELASFRASSAQEQRTYWETVDARLIDLLAAVSTEADCIKAESSKHVSELAGSIDTRHQAVLSLIEDQSRRLAALEEVSSRIVDQATSIEGRLWTLHEATGAARLEAASMVKKMHSNARGWQLALAALGIANLASIAWILIGMS